MLPPTSRVVEGVNDKVAATPGRPSMRSALAIENDADATRESSLAALAAPTCSSCLDDTTLPKTLVVLEIKFGAMPWLGTLPVAGAIPQKPCPELDSSIEPPKINVENATALDRAAERTSAPER